MTERLPLGGNMKMIVHEVVLFLGFGKSLSIYNGNYNRKHLVMSI